MEFITLSNNNYKEKDGIVSGLTNEGGFTFKAKGINDPKSKNIALANPLLVCDIELIEGNYKHPILKASKVMISPYSTSDSLEKLASISMINEVSSKIIQEDELVKVYDYLKSAIIALKENKANPLIVTLIYIAKVLTNIGYEFEVNHCVFCGKKKNIVAFSFIEGGFICNDCIDIDIQSDLTSEQMRIMRAIFLLKEYVDIPDASEHDIKVVLEKLVNFIEDGIGYTLKSYSLIK